MYKNMKKFIILFAVLTMAIWVQAQELKVGDIMPKFELKSSVYGDIKPADLEGKVVLISLFATWCGPCQKELAEVQSTLWPKYKDNKDLVMLVIGREHTDAELQKYNERKKFTFPLYPDPKREVFSKFAEKSIPRAYLFDKDGKLIYSSIGYTQEEFQHLLKAIENAL
jgi:peroxiredoxin